MSIVYFLSLDYYVEYKHKSLALYVKKVKYLNYTKLLSVDGDWILSDLVNFRKFTDSIDKYVKSYIEEE